MQKKISAANVVALLLVFAHILRGSTENDHLNPVHPKLEPAYEKLLTEFLFKTPANYARIVWLPSAASVGECAISIRSDGKDDDGTVITCTTAERNIWYAASELNHDLSQRPRLKVQTKDTRFPRSLAELISFRLRKTMSHRAPIVRTKHIPVDGTDILFSVPDGRARELSALLDQVAEGKVSSSLRRLQKLLRQYCEVEPSGRSRLETEIASEARRLP